jgi:hypothetical protein
MQTGIWRIYLEQSLKKSQTPKKKKKKRHHRHGWKVARNDGEIKEIHHSQHLVFLTSFFATPFSLSLL